MSSSQDESIPSGEKDQEYDALPDEIVLKKDYSCYCTVCDCTLNRVKDALQHVKGKRHKKAVMMRNAKESNSNLKRLTSAVEDGGAKKIKTEETEEERQAREMLSKVFDETFHSGVVALADNYYCKVCRCMIGNNRKNVNQHKEGKSHKMALEKFKSSLLAGTIKDDIPVEDPDSAPFGDRFVEKTKNAKRKTVYYCKLCDLRTKEHDVMEAHVRDKKHLDNVQYEEEKEIMAQSEDYYGYQHNYYAQGTADNGMYSSEFTGSGYERWGSYATKGYYNTAKPPVHSKKESLYSSDFQNGIAKNKWDHSSKELGADQQIEAASVDNGPLMMAQQLNDQQVNSLPTSQQAQAPCLPAVQQAPVPFIPQSQQIAVTFMPTQPPPMPFIAPVPLATVPLSQSQQTTFPVAPHIQSQQNALQAPVQAPEPTEKSQTFTAAFGGLPGFITSDNDADVVIDVIDSLLQTYLKYKLQALPGSLIKLLRKTSKGEETVTSANRDIIDKTTKQIFQNTQNLKTQSLISEDFSPATSFNDIRSSKAVRKESSSHQTAPKTSMSTTKYGSYSSFEIDDSYDRRSYIEDQLKRAFTCVTRRHSSEDGTSKKAKQIESSIADFIKQCRERAEKRIELHSDLFKKFGLSSREKAMRNIGQSSASNFYRHYSYTDNAKHRGHPTDFAISNLPTQYNKKDNKSLITKNSESSNTDVDNRLPLPVFSQQTESFRKDSRTSKNPHQDTQSILDLFKKYRGSDTYS